MIIDSHAHLQMSQFDPDRDEVLERASQAGIDQIIVSGYDLASSREAVKLAERPACYATVGISPHAASSATEEAYEELRALAGQPKVVALGEIGLDYYRQLSSKPSQRQAFRTQLKLAVELGLPVVIHARDAFEEIEDVLAPFVLRLKGVVFHCFSGDYTVASTWVDRGCLLSLSGMLTYPNAKGLQDVARRIPTESFLLETDAPYLTPQPRRGKRNEPANVRMVAEQLASLKGLSPEDVCRITTLNARTVFSLDGLNSRGRIAYPIRHSLYLNITNECTNQCKFCIRFRSDYVKGHNLRLEREPSTEEIIAALDDLSQYEEVVFCGLGEPLLRLNTVKEVAGYLKGRNVRVRLNTNGQGNLIHGRDIVPELEGLVDEVSVSLNASSAEKYDALCQSRYGRGAYEEVLKFLQASKKHIPTVAVTVLDMDEAEVERCRAIATEHLGVGFRVRHYNEVG